MRVWVLASCGGLLALSACSTDQTGSSPLDSSPLLDDELTQWDAQPEVATPPSRLTTRPETRAVQPLPSPTVGARRQSTTLSPAQLRARVAQLRTQMAQASTSTAVPRVITTKLVATDTGSHPSSPQVALTLGPGVSSKPALGTTPPMVVTPVANLNRPSPANLSFAEVSVAAETPTPDTPIPNTPAELTPTEVNGPINLPSAVDLGPTEPATLANNFPIRPDGHQGTNNRRNPTPVILSQAPIAADIQAGEALFNSPAVHQTALLPEAILASQPLFPRSEPADSAFLSLEEPTPDEVALEGSAADESGPNESAIASPGEVLFPPAESTAEITPEFVETNRVDTDPIEPALAAEPTPNPVALEDSDLEPANLETALSAPVPDPDGAIDPTAAAEIPVDATPPLAEIPPVLPSPGLPSNAEANLTETDPTALSPLAEPAVQASPEPTSPHWSSVDRPVAVTPIPATRPLPPSASTHLPQFSEPRPAIPLPLSQETTFQPAPQVDGTEAWAEAPAQPSHDARSAELSLAAQGITPPPIDSGMTDPTLGTTGTAVCSERDSERDPLAEELTSAMTSSLAQDRDAGMLPNPEDSLASDDPALTNCW